MITKSFFIWLHIRRIGLLTNEEKIEWIFQDSKLVNGFPLARE